MGRFAFTALAALALAACERSPESAADNGLAHNVTNAANAAAAAEPALASCPFQRTREWVGSVEAGWLNVTGRVDLMMAGMRPQLSPRAGAPPGTVAFDLELVSEPSAPVTDLVRYQTRGAPNYRRGEIWCGGERIAAFPMIVVG